ncbi:cytochrome c oxidase subunit II [Phenylobacterium sp.]|uniref:cytochrome c oxidase subunit II n=1 Tax=Phenylobacterium sp. TaxID=1871053 RepID=UPI0026056D97|nr:cytochrome c oxidase subunit II [Phenylobacterium sp.]
MASAPFTPASPMGFWQTFGPRADPVTALNWGFSALSVAVVVIVTVLVVAGVVTRAQRGVTDMAGLAVSRPPGGMRWIYIGVALTFVALVASLIWTVAVLAAVNSPAGRPAVTLEVTGHQWWWEVAYDGGPGESFTTANEIHIPAGAPVEVKLKGADVIHSFWIPALTGKTDTIPGRTNLAWLQADRPGVYRGQCAEYCGEQHAHMALYVKADAPADFEAWRQGQLKPGAVPATPDAIAGQQVFFERCGACHTVRGTEAGGAVGPDLTHLMSRTTIAAGTLPNTVANLSGWIENPQALKPGAKMPATYVPPAQLAQLRAYLETLR